MTRPLRTAAVLVLLVASGCDLSGRVERGLEEQLPRAIGPADRYDVTVEGLRAQSGEADRVVVLGENVRPEGVPAIRRLDLDLRGVRYDRGEKRLERVDEATATARITPAALGAFLETQDGVREAAVSLRPPDAATVRVRPDIEGVRLPAGVALEATGRLRSEGGELRFEVEEVRALGADLGGYVARRVSDALNPLADLSGTTPPLTVTGVRVEADAVVLEATGDLAGLRLR